MIDRWYYTHNGRMQGPVSAAQLRQLATDGMLIPTDLIWPEGRQQSEAVPAQAAIDFSSPAAPSSPLNTKPDWLDDIRGAAKAEKKPAEPDWLDDVRAAEEDEQAFLPLDWDGENAATAEEE